jgi:hypothetical protein
MVLRRRQLVVGELAAQSDAWQRNAHALILAEGLVQQVRDVVGA